MSNIAQLINDLIDTDPDVRSAAAEELGCRNKSAEVAVPAIAEALHHTDSIVRYRASELLGCIGSATAIQPLIASLGDEDDRVRRGVIWALGALGLKAADAMPALTKILRNGDLDVREDVEWALRRIATPAKIER